MPYTAPTFTTTAVITGATLISNTDEQVNILMGDVGSYLQTETQAGIDAAKVEIDTANTNKTNIDLVANNIADVITNANNIVDINTVAGSIVDVNAYANTYKISATAPVSPNAGDLWYDTVTDTLKVYHSIDGWSATNLAIPEFRDTEFKVFGNTDSTKKARFDAETNIPTGTEIVIKLPSKDIDLEDLAYPRTLTPVISYTSTVVEQTPTVLTITNYDSNLTYTIETSDTSGSLVRTNETITYTSSDMTVDTNVTINVRAQDDVNQLKVSYDYVATINVLKLDIINDTTDAVGVNDGVLLYQGADMSTTYISEVAGDTTHIDNQKIKTSRVAFSTKDYTGNGTSLDLVNGIKGTLNGTPVAKRGGQLWLKNRDSGTDLHNITSTVMGVFNYVRCSSTAAQFTEYDRIIGINSNGFKMGTEVDINRSANNFVAWSHATTMYTNGYTNHGKFYEAEWNPDTGFFQIVFEGSGIINQELPNVLGSLIEVTHTKNLSIVEHWRTQHGQDGNASTSGYLNLANALTVANNLNITTDTITIDTNHQEYNASGNKYYMCGYANIAGKVKVGTYSGTGTTGNIVSSLGFDPKHLIIKRVNSAGGWVIYDSDRGSDNYLQAHIDSQEINNALLQVVLGTDQFSVNGTNDNINFSGDTYLYIAIADHEAHETTLYTGTGATKDVLTGLNMNVEDGSGSTVEIDRVGGMTWTKGRSSALSNFLFSSLNGKDRLITNDTVASTNNGTFDSFTNTGIKIPSDSNVNGSGVTYVNWSLPTTKYISGYTNHGKPYEVEYNPVTGFFQGVYVGSTLNDHQIPHGMGVAPDFFVVKNLESVGQEWVCYNKSEGATKWLRLDSTTASTANSLNFNDTEPTASYINLGTNGTTNGVAVRYYFFGFVNTAGKIKVGTYTGTGTSNPITGLGFQPAFLMTKRLNLGGAGIGDWSIYDSARNNNGGTADRLEANTSDAEDDSTNNIITLDADGFTPTTGGENTNASGGTYIYVAIDASAMGINLYTGNGSEQEVITGLDMKRAVTYPEIPGMMSWFKSKASALDHAIYDTVRGVLKEIKSSTNGVQLDRTDTLLKFNTDGVSLGAGLGINTNLDTLINWSWGTTHEYRGVNNHGKPYHAQWNPLSGYVQIKYTGSGTDGLELPTFLGKALNLSVIKCLTQATTDWIVHHNIGYNYERGLRMNKTDAVSATVDRVAHDNDVVRIEASTGSYINQSGQEYILYGWANSMTQEIIEYDGTGVAGNFIKTKKKPGYVMVKQLDSANSWNIYDNKRINVSGNNDGILYADLNSTENTSQSRVEFYDDGILLTANNVEYNASGGRYLAFVMYETDEDTQGAKYYG